jgi:hypothetical protein
MSARPLAREAADLIEKKHNSSPQSPQRTPRKKSLINLRALCVLSGETLHKNGIEFKEVSYKCPPHSRALNFAGLIEAESYLL